MIIYNHTGCVILTSKYCTPCTCYGNNNYLSGRGEILLTTDSPPDISGALASRIIPFFESTPTQKTSFSFTMVALKYENDFFFKFYIMQSLRI